MSKNLAMKIMAAVSGAAMLCTSASISSFAVSADSSSDGIVFKADFEDGDVSAFSKRGDTDTGCYNFMYNMELDLNLIG